MTDLATVIRVAEERLDSCGGVLLHRFAALNLWTAVLLVAALTLDRLLSRRVRAAWRIALYAPVALRVVVPLEWSIPVAGVPHLVSVFTRPSLFATAAMAHPADYAASSSPSWQALAAAVYLAGVAALAVRAVIGRTRLDLLLSAARVIPSSDPGVPCPILEHEVLGPMAVGLVTPHIVLPRELLESGDAHTLACVLRHELAHLRRRDGWLAAGMQLLAIAAWPTLPVWIAVARVRQLMELACDEAALEGADATDRRRYAHALLDVAEWRSTAVVPQGSSGLHFGSTLRARIEALASQRHWPRAVQAVLVSVAPVALFAACAASASPPATPAADEDYGYRFEVDTARAMAAGSATPGPLAASRDGRIPPEIVQAAVRSHYGAFRACYDAGLKRDPRLTGIVDVKYVVGRDGATLHATDVGKSDEPGTSLADKDVVACVAAEFAKISYPKGPGTLTVVYPIAFE